MALTATAQNKVQEDIIRSLGIEGCAVLKQSFNRPNLHYEIRPKNKSIIEDMVGFINTQPQGASGIIYCSSRDKCEDIAKLLRENHGLRAQHYHAGMTKGDRRKNQEGWQEHDFEIIVATVSSSCHGFLELTVRSPLEWGSTSRTSDSSFIMRYLGLWRATTKKQAEQVEMVYSRLAFCTTLSAITLQSLGSLIATRNPPGNRNLDKRQRQMR